jgi:hypothetical protein
MFVLFIERDGNMHIVDYKSARGFYRAVCGKVVFQNELVNTIAADASIDSICRTCHETYNEMYISDLDVEPRMARNNSYLSITKLLEYTKMGYMRPEAKYAYFLKHKVTGKLNRYKALTNKTNKYAK